MQVARYRERHRSTLQRSGRRSISRLVGLWSAACAPAAVSTALRDIGSGAQTVARRHAPRPAWPQRLPQPVESIASIGGGAGRGGAGHLVGGRPLARTLRAGSVRRGDPAAHRPAAPRLRPRADQGRRTGQVACRHCALTIGENEPMSAADRTDGTEDVHGSPPHGYCSDGSARRRGLRVRSRSTGSLSARGLFRSRRTKSG